MKFKKGDVVELLEGSHLDQMNAVAGTHAIVVKDCATGHDFVHIEWIRTSTNGPVLDKHGKELFQHSGGSRLLGLAPAQLPTCVGDKTDLPVST